MAAICKREKNCLLRIWCLSVVSYWRKTDALEASEKTLSGRRLEGAVSVLWEKSDISRLCFSSYSSPETSAKTEKKNNQNENKVESLNQTPRLLITKYWISLLFKSNYTVRSIRRDQKQVFYTSENTGYIRPNFSSFDYQVLLLTFHFFLRKIESWGMYLHFYLMYAHNNGSLNLLEIFLSYFILP